MPYSACKKLKILEKVLKQGKSVTQVCLKAGISRKTLYQWKKKYLQAPSRIKKQSLKPNYISGKNHPKNKRYQFKNRVINIVVHYPKLGSSEISRVLSQGKKKISNHAVYSLLRDLNLEIREKREEFSSLYQTLAKIKDLYQPGVRRLTPETRKRMIEEVVIGNEPVLRICRKYNISRKTFYHWKKKYQSAVRKEKVLLEAMKDDYINGLFHPKSILETTQEKILEIARENPAYSTHKIAQILPGVGNHGVQNVFKRLNLNTYEKRLTYAKTHQPVLKPLPVTAWTDRLKIVWDKFIPTLAPSPPPEFVKLLNRKTLKFLFPSFLLGFICSIIFSLSAYSWFKLFFQTTSLSAKLGYFFTSTALLTGSLFFIYSMKYYITLAIVLSFSRHTNGNGENGRNGFSFALNGQNNKRGNGGNNNNSILGLLGKVFGVSINGGSENNISGGGSARNAFSIADAGGLQSNLDHIKLKRHPFVSIHIPLYNEKRVAERLLKACSSIKYPHYEIIVCDDSTDETTSIVERFVQQWNSKLKAQSSKPFIKVLHRNTRQGYKGAALKNALKHMDKRTEFVVVFDADFIPYPDTLELFLKYFVANGLDISKTPKFQTSKIPRNHQSPITNHQTPNIAAVSGYQSACASKLRRDEVAQDGSNIAAVSGYQWHVLNKSENWITRGVRSEYAGSYVIERPGREILGLLKQISGSVYMIRADVLKKIGWGTSITEDFELTLKLYEQGYKVVYTPYIQAPAECVSTIKRLIRQRMRWAEGHSNNIRKMFKRLVTSPNLTFPEKLEVLYLTPYYLQAAFFLLGTFCWLISETVFKARLPFWTSLWGWSLVLTNFFALPLVNAVGLFLEESEEKDYAGLLSFILLSYILVPFQAYASIKGFLNKEEGPWFRTPKTGRITDVFKRGKFYRWVSGILPGRAASHIRMNTNKNIRMNANNNIRNNSEISHSGQFGYKGYLALATANNPFNNFKIRPKRIRWISRTVLSILLCISTTVLSLAPSIHAFSHPYQPVSTMRTGTIVLPKKKLSFLQSSFSYLKDKLKDFSLVRQAHACESTQITSANTNTIAQGARVLVRNSSGALYAIIEDTNDDTIEVWKEDSGWSEVDDTDAPSGTVYGSSSAAIDSNNIIHIAFMQDDAKSSNLMYITFNAGTDQFVGTEDTLVDDIGEDPEAITNLQTAIAIDSSNKPHIAYTSRPKITGTTTFVIEYANKTGANWVTGVDVEVTSGIDCHCPDITIDADDKPEISYIQTVSGGDVKAAIGSANNAVTFTLEPLDSQDAGWEPTKNDCPSIAVDSLGNTHVAYGIRQSSAPADNELLIRKHNYGAAWNSWQAIETIDGSFSTTDSLPNTSLVIDGTDRYVFVEDDDISDIVYYTDSGGSWSSQNTLETGETAYQDVKAKWAFWVDNDSGGALVSVADSYYFNASDAGPTDLGDDWTNDENAFTFFNYAYAAWDPGVLEGTGTNVPTSGNSVIQVEGRLFAGSNLDASAWSNYVALTPPSGFWTWQKVNDLEVEFTIPATEGVKATFKHSGTSLKTVTISINSSATEGRVYTAEIRVTTRSSSSEIDYLFSDGSDIHYNYIPENLWVFLGVIPFISSFLRRRRRESK